MGLTGTAWDTYAHQCISCLLRFKGAYWVWRQMMNHALLTRRDADGKARKESHIERLRRVASEADAGDGTDVTHLSAEELIAMARRA